MMTDYVQCYALLRFLGFNEISDTFIDYFLVDPIYARIYLETAFDLLGHPQIDPFKANLSFGIDKIQNAKKMGIGAHLLPKNASFPDNWKLFNDKMYALS